MREAADATLAACAATDAYITAFELLCMPATSSQAYIDDAHVYFDAARHNAQAWATVYALADAARTRSATAARGAVAFNAAAVYHREYSMLERAASKPCPSIVLYRCTHQ